MSNEGKPHRDFVGQIAATDLSVLKTLIGCSVYRLLAPCIQLAGQHITAPSFSIPLSDKTETGWKHRFIVVKCDWFETPEFLIDYWTMHVSDAEAPDGIEVNSTGAIVAPCTVNFYKAEPITSIDIYRFEWAEEGDANGEAVMYDKAIVFHTADGKTFCIACQLNGPGIATEVHLSEQDDVIREFLEGSEMRISIS